MAYQITEQEMLVHYDHQTQKWTLETNVKTHIYQIYKFPERYTILHEEKEDGRVISVKATVNTEDFNINRFSKQKPVRKELSEEEKEVRRERMFKNIHSKGRNRRD